MPPTERETLVENIQKQQTERANYSERYHKISTKIAALEEKKREHNVENKPAIQQLQEDIDALEKQRNFWKIMITNTDTMIQNMKKRLDTLNKPINKTSPTRKRPRSFAGGATLPPSKRESLIDQIQAYQSQIGDLRQIIADYENELRGLGSQLKQAKTAEEKARVRAEMRDYIMNKRFTLASMKSIRKQIERLEAQVKALNAAGATA